MPPIGHMDWIGFGSAFRSSLWIGLDWVTELIDWIGFRKLDPRPTMVCITPYTTCFTTKAYVS